MTVFAEMFFSFPNYFLAKVDKKIPSCSSSQNTLNHLLDTSWGHFEILPPVKVSQIQIFDIGRFIDQSMLMTQRTHYHLLAPLVFVHR